MLTITDYVFAPVVSDDIASYVKSLIQDHHETFQELYSSARIIPKMHYMLHLPEWIQRYKINCDMYDAVEHIHMNVYILSFYGFLSFFPDLVHHLDIGV